MRQDKGKYAVQSSQLCTYHDEFAKEKLVWMDLVEIRDDFAHDDDWYVLREATCFMMSGAVSMKYLCAVCSTPS